MVTLPPEAAALAERWEFVPTELLEGGYCSHVYANADRVLKIPFRGEELDTGWKMAVALSGSIGPTVFESDPATGAALMERVLPGTRLSEHALSDSEALMIWKRFRDVVSVLPVSDCMPLEGYYSQRNPLLEKLLATTSQTVALHGDLHHDNILQSADGWAVIDPKGLCGDPTFEAVAFLRNPIARLAAESDLVGLLRRRLWDWSEALGFSASRMWAWASVDAEIDPEPDDSQWAKIRVALQELRPEFEPFV